MDDVNNNNQAQPSTPGLADQPKPEVSTPGSAPVTAPPPTPSVPPAMPSDSATAPSAPASFDPPASVSPGTMGGTYDPPKSGTAVKAIGLLVLAIIVIGAMAAGGYYLGMHVGTTAPEPTPAQTIEPLATPTATPDPTASWKSYVNEKYYFSLKHPDTFTELTEKEGGVSGSLTGKPTLITTLGDKSTITTGSDKPFDGFSVYVIDISKTTMDKFIEGEVSAVKKSKSGVADASSVSMKVGDLTFIVVHREDSIIDYYIATPDEKSVIALSNSVGSSKEYPDTFKNILSTFEFTDATMKESPSPTPTP